MCTALLPLLKATGVDDGSPVFRTDHTSEALEGTGVCCLAMERELWARYLASLQDVGYLPEPTGDKTAGKRPKIRGI